LSWLIFILLVFPIGHGLVFVGDIPTLNWQNLGRNPCAVILCLSCLRWMVFLKNVNRVHHGALIRNYCTIHRTLCIDPSEKEKKLGCMELLRRWMQRPGAANWPCMPTRLPGYWARGVQIRLAGFVQLTKLFMFRDVNCGRSTSCCQDFQWMYVSITSQ